MISPSESRARTTYIDDSRAHAIEVMSSNPVVKSVFSSEVIDTTIIKIEDMFVPNIRDDRISIPRRYRNSERIPVVAIGIGEQLLTGAGLGMTPIQKQHAGNLLSFWHELLSPDDDVVDTEPIIDEINLTLNDDADVAEHLYTYDPMIKGFTTSINRVYKVTKGKSATSTIPNRRAFLGRPIIGLALPCTTRDKIARPSTLLHEFVHAQQIILNPVTGCPDDEDFLDIKLRMELEARHVAGALESALYHSDDARYRGRAEFLNNNRIDQIRAEHALTDDPFAPLQAVKEALLNAGLDI